jgi:hypothetical protein
MKPAKRRKAKSSESSKNTQSLEDDELVEDLAEFTDVSIYLLFIVKLTRT